MCDEGNYKKVFNPSITFSLFICISAVILLFCIFYKQLDNSLFAHIVYPYSAYALIIFIIKFVKFCKFIGKYIKENSRIYKMYQFNSSAINKYTLIIGLGINLLYGVFKLSTGIYYKSWWFITFASYYLMLCFIKLELAKSFEQNKSKQYKNMKLIGIVLIVMNIVLTGITILIMESNQIFNYPGNLIYLVALYDFYLIINAIVNVFKYRAHNEPVLIASKFLNLTVAMVSIISLEVAMIYTFGNNDSEFKRTMTGILGFVVITINTIMAIRLIIKANKNIKFGKERIKIV